VVSIESVTVRCKIDETVSFETGLNCLIYFLRVQQPWRRETPAGDRVRARCI
jgi:hypothetical protein